MGANYLGRLYATCEISGGLKYVLVIIWLLYPVSIATILHPTDAAGFQAWLQGLDIPRYVSQRAVDAGFLEALIVLCILFLFHLVIVTLIYRRTQIMVHFWPLALILVGVIANGIWWLVKGHFDPAGAMTGLGPVALAIGAHGVAERLGADFVFGKEARAR
jgi:hypothetical protein